MESPSADNGGRPSLMVAIRKGYKSYGDKSVLRDFNMSVTKGSIYAFLGPSGCGKTTILTCLTGQRDLDSGQITLGIQYRDDIGYMPQDIALPFSLSVWEIMNFYRLLYGFSKEYMKKRLTETYSFFNIPKDAREIGTLSGGEKRRVSLCVALLHDPQLLILDEPTVGLDPVLNVRTWEFLKYLTKKENKTILMTTHYIEEAKRADRVGMMRHGILLVEGCPKTIMDENGTNSLEHVFLRLSQVQEMNQIHHVSEEVELHYNTDKSITAERKSPIKSRDPISFEHVYAQIYKQICWMIHNKLVFFFLLTLAMFSCLLYGLAIGKNPEHLKMGIINEELENGRDVDCKMHITFDCSNPIHSSCWFMKHLDKRKMILVDFKDEESALQASKKNYIWGYIQLNSNFTSSLMDRLKYKLATPEDIVERSEVFAKIDMSNEIIGNLLKRDMFFAFVDYLEELYKICGWPIEALRLPLKYEPAIYGSLYPDFVSFGVPSILVLILFFFPMAFISGGLLMEKGEGFYDRKSISGLTILESFVGDAIFTFWFVSMQAISIFIVFFVIFAVPLKGNILLLCYLSIFCCISGICYGYCISVMIENIHLVGSIQVSSIIGSSILSGIFWPFEGMHIALQRIAYFLPQTLAIKAFESIIFRGYGLTNPIVYSSSLMFLAWICICNFATYYAVKRKI